MNQVIAFEAGPMVQAGEDIESSRRASNLDRLGENLNAVHLPDVKPAVSDEFELTDEIGLFGLYRLLSDKFDATTASILSEYTADFWGDEETTKKALKFLIEKNCSKQFKFYINKNWQGKRYCNDISHLLKLSGYPRLWYYDKNMVATKKCHEYMLSCEYKPRNHTILIKEGRPGSDYLREKRKLTKRITQVIKTNFGDYPMKDYNFPKCSLKNYKLRVAKTNVFNTKDKVYNKLITKIDDSLKEDLVASISGDLLSKSMKANEKVSKKVSYAEKVSENLPLACEDVVMKGRCKILKPIISESLKECIKFRRELSLHLGVKTVESSWYVADGWHEPKKVYRVRLHVGGEKFSTNTSNIFDILRGYEEDCELKLKKIEEKITDSLNVSLEDIADHLKADSIISRKKIHKKARMKREWSEPKPLDPQAQSDLNFNLGRVPAIRKRNKTWAKMWNRRQDEIFKSSKKGEVSNHIKVMTHYQQFRSTKVTKVRKSRTIFEALKNIKKTDFFFVKFPKLEILPTHDERAKYKVRPKDQLRITNPKQYHTRKGGIIGYDHPSGKLELNSDLGKRTGSGGLAFFDSNWVLRFLVENDRVILMCNRKGNHAEWKTPYVMPKITFLRMEMSTDEVDWRISANEFGVHGKGAYEELRDKYDFRKM
jgi:hypothetical protein